MAALAAYLVEYNKIYLETRESKLCRVILIRF